MELKKFIPWNWFKKEDAASSAAGEPEGKGEISPILQLHREMDRLFENMLGLGGSQLNLARTMPALRRPCVNVSETSDEYRLDLELPGVAPEEVEVTVRDGTLAVRGEKRAQAEEKDRSYHRIERAYGSFQRLFSLPDDADEEAIQANFNNGVLSIHVTRKAPLPEPPARKIPVLSASSAG